MKTLNRHILIFSIIIWTVSNSFSTPLNGTYTIGNGGTYPTINSAISDTYLQGINGPVIFDIISGTYNESVAIFTIPGSSAINTLTLKSQSGNSGDVYINGGFHIHSTNIIINELTLGDLNDTVKFGGSNINFTDNNFNNVYLYLPEDYGNSQDIFISGNVIIGKLYFGGLSPPLGFYPTNIHFTENIIIGEVRIGNCKDVFIEKNTFEGDFRTWSVNLNIIKNRITGNVISAVPLGSGKTINNFIKGTFHATGAIINNTIIGGTSLDATIKCYNSYLLNNIIINAYGGTALNFYIGIENSDYNNIYNGGGNNLIQFEDTFYNSVNAFHNATGFDQHSNSRPVNFVSSTDLHLTGTSIGDEQLLGIPNAAIPDDIDDDPRNPIFPYKGADEVDIVLPVELVSLTSLVNQSNVTLNWQTNRETNNSGFDIERSIVNEHWTKAGFVKGNGTTNTMSDYTFTDRNLATGKYKYRLKQIDFNGSFEYFNLAGEVIVEVPKKYELSQNYPNPFNPSTVIRYSLTENAFTSLKIYDITAKEVAKLINQKQDAGRYEVIFNGSNFASGVYFYELRSGNFVSQKRMLLLK